MSVTGLNVGIFFLRNFQVMIGLWPAVFSLKKWEDRVVLFLGMGSVILALCLLYLFCFFARPTYV